MFVLEKNIIRYNFFGERDFLFLTEFLGEFGNFCHFELSQKAKNP